MGIAVTLLRLVFRNLTSGAPLTDAAAMTRVSLTTHGARVRTVYRTIESVGWASTRPAEVTLWLDREASPRFPRSLRRLQRRGLQIRVEGERRYGPHNKYWRALTADTGDHRWLVTADDDVIYPSTWLRDLTAALLAAGPKDIPCYRAYEIHRRSDGTPQPYATFPLAGRSSTGPLLLTGVSGVAYSPEFQQVLLAHGETFLECAPRADDVWLSAIAMKHGYVATLVHEHSEIFLITRASQTGGLRHSNVAGGQNDLQLARTFVKLGL